MTTEQEITELRQRLEKLEQEQLAPMQASLLHLRAKFTPSGYLDTRYQPQLTGDVTHLAGTEPVLVPTSRYSWVAPVNGDGIGVCQADQDEDITIIDTGTEEGFLSTIGVVVTKSTGAAGTVDVYLDVTIDGGTTQSRQFVFAARLFGTALSANVARTAAAAGVQAGGSKEDALLFHFNIGYRTGLEVHLRAENAAGFTGGVDEYDLAAIVDRSVLTTA